MKTKTIQKILEYILVICIILEFNTTYCVFPIIKRIVQIFPIFTLILLILLNNRRSSRTGIYLAIYLVGSIFPLFILNNDSYVGYCLRFILLLPLFWIFLSQRKLKGLDAYISVPLHLSNVITILAAISFIMWLACSIFELIPPTFIMPYQWAPDIYFIPSYYMIYFETQDILFLGEQIFRNSGIFNEAPMYNMILCTAFGIEYFIRPQQSKLRLFILGITILSTITTTGQLFLIAIIAWHLYKNISKRYQMLLTFIAPIIVGIIYIVANIIIETKIESGGEGSVDLRSEDIEYCLKVGMQNPIMGIGIIPSENDITWQGIQIGRSNSLFTVFARGGVYVLTLYITALLIIPFLYFYKYRNVNWLIMMISYFGLFTITISYINFLTFLFIAWGLSNIDLKQYKQTKYCIQNKT